MNALLEGMDLMDLLLFKETSYITVEISIRRLQNASYVLMNSLI